MKNFVSWLDDGQHKKSKFINQRIHAGEEFIGIYKAANKTKNNYGKTIHYLLDGEGEGLIFDSNNQKIADIFASIPFESRISIKKVSKNGKLYYDVKLLNTLQDEEDLAKFASGCQRAGEDKGEENKRDERSEENER